jgi:hypothetical protein
LVVAGDLCELAALLLVGLSADCAGNLEAVLGEQVGCDAAASGMI